MKGEKICFEENSDHLEDQLRDLQRQISSVNQENYALQAQVSWGVGARSLIKGLIGDERICGNIQSIIFYPFTC